MNGRVAGFGAVIGSVSLLGGEVAYAHLRRLPDFAGFDPSGTFGDPRAPTLRLTLLGDSAITGQGLRHAEDSWPRLVARRLSDRFRVVVRSYALGGARSLDVLTNQLPTAEIEEHDIVIISVGSNDILHVTPVWLFERRLDEIITRLKDVASSVILFGVGDLGSVPRVPFPIDRLAAVSGHVADRVHRRVADRHGVAKIDQWGLTTEAFNSGRHMFAPDLFHPSAEGHLAWADAVYPTVEEELRRLGIDARSSSW
jgi:lysophospholipase L1-like esterase